MNKLIKRILVELLVASLLINPLITYAQSKSADILPENNLCADIKDKMVMGFFNGVFTTKKKLKSLMFNFLLI